MKALVQISALVLAALLSAAPAGANCPVVAGYPETTPDSDFADEGAGLVRHLATGLVWKRCAEGQDWDGSTCTGPADAYTWQQAFIRADAVNAGTQGWNAGYADWRLPNINELRSILELGCSNPSINTTQFPPASTPNSSIFWSGTPVAGYSVLPWSVSFALSSDNWTSKLNTYQVRLVRAGQFFYHFDAAATPPAISGLPPVGTVGVLYSFAPATTGTLPIDYSATGLPGGLSIDPATGVISGIPTVPGIFLISITGANVGGPVTVTYNLTILAASVAVPLLPAWALLALGGLMGLLGWRKKS